MEHSVGFRMENISDDEAIAGSLHIGLFKELEIRSVQNNKISVHPLPGAR